MRAVSARTGPEKAPYYFLEVIDYGREAIHASDYLALGASGEGSVDVTEFKFTAVGDKFLNKDGAKLAELRTLNETTWNLLPSDRSVVFTTNHDLERGSAVYYADGPYFELASVFLLAWPYGYPSILSSYAFDRSTPAGRDSGPPGRLAGKTLLCSPIGGDSPSCAPDPATPLRAAGSASTAGRDRRDVRISHEQRPAQRASRASGTTAAIRSRSAAATRASS